MSADTASIGYIVLMITPTLLNAYVHTHSCKFAMKRAGVNYFIGFGAAKTLLSSDGSKSNYTSKIMFARDINEAPIFKYLFHPTPDNTVHIDSFMDISKPLPTEPIIFIDFQNSPCQMKAVADFFCMTNGEFDPSDNFIPPPSNCF
jgi:hypothetical protein